MHSRCLLSVFVLPLMGAHASSQAVDPQDAILSVERIWDRAPHSAFTDLVEHEGRLWCSFREGSGHVPGTDGLARVIVSDDGMNWASAALLDTPGVDLRDPKLCSLPDGRLMLVLGGSVYDGSTLLRRDPHVAFLEPGAQRFSAPEIALIDERVRGDRDWLWRVSSFAGAGWGVVYQPVAEAWGLHLVRTQDGRHYEHVTSFELEGMPNEVSLALGQDGRMVAVVRREGANTHALIGAARAPFTDWRFHDLGERVGGPHLVQLEGGAWIVGGRRYASAGARMQLARVDPDTGAFEHLLDLPSGGDTSYPGFVLRADELLVSYYSSHEGKASIYLARVRTDALAGE